MAITPAPGYMVDPNNPNAVVKAPTTATPGSYAAIQQQASQPSIAFGAVNTGPIPVSTLTSNATPYTPPPQPPMPQVAPTVTGAIAGATTPPPVTTPTESMSFSERLKTMLGSDANTFLSKPTSLAEKRTALRSEYDIAGKEKVVNDLSAQLASITAKYQTAPLILEQQAEGRGITTDVLNRQQAQAQRNYAIEALPITAALNAAQGRLDSANKNITELLGVIKEDQDATYTYQKDVLARAIDIASEDQKRELEARSAQLDAQKARQTQFNSLKEGFIQEAINAGDYTTAGRLANATNEQEVQNLFSQITAKTNTQLLGSASTGYFTYNPVTGETKRISGGGGGGTDGADAGVIPGLTPTQQADPFIKKLLASAGGKDLTDTSIQSLTKGLNVLGQLGTLQNSVQNISTGPITGLFRGANPWDTNAQSIKAQLNAIVPNLARGIYGEVGVLTDNDIKQYAKTIPNLTSTEDVRNAVLGITLDLIGKSIKNTLEVNAAAGRDVSRFVDLYTSMISQRDSIFNQIGVTKSFQELGITKKDEDIFGSVVGGQSTPSSSTGGFFSSIWKGITGQ